MNNCVTSAVDVTTMTRTMRLRRGGTSFAIIVGMAVAAAFFAYGCVTDPGTPTPGPTSTPKPRPTLVFATTPTIVPTPTPTATETPSPTPEPTASQYPFADNHIHADRPTIGDGDTN